MVDMVQDIVELVLTFMQGALADVGVGSLQQVVGDESHRTLTLQRAAHCFAPKASLQLIKPQWCFVPFAPADHLPIEHGSLRQGRSHIHELREAVVHKLFTPAPQINARAAMDQLAADAIPFPFNPPVAGWCLNEAFRLQWTGQKEGLRHTAGLLFFRSLRSRQGKECSG